MAPYFIMEGNMDELRYSRDLAGCNEKRELLKSICTDFDIRFDKHREEYEITHKGFPFQRVAWDGFDKKVVEHIRKTVYINENGNIVDEIDKENAKIDKAKEKEQTDMNIDMAKEIRKAIIKDN